MHVLCVALINYCAFCVCIQNSHATYGTGRYVTFCKGNIHSLWTYYIQYMHMFMLKASEKRAKTSEWKRDSRKSGETRLDTVSKYLCSCASSWTMNSTYIATCCGMQEINPHPLLCSQYSYTCANNLIPTSVLSITNLAVLYIGTVVVKGLKFHFCD